MNDSKQRKIGVILSYAIIGLNMLVAIFYTPIVTSKLGQSEYGLYQYVKSIIDYMTLLDLGLGNAIIIFISRTIKNNDKKEENKLFTLFFMIYSIVSIIAVIIGIILLCNVEILFNSTITIEEIQKAKVLLAILVVNIAISFPGSVFSNTINAHENFIFIKALNIIKIILQPIILIPLLYLGYGSIVLVLYATIANLIVILINYIYCRKKIKIRFNFEKIDKNIFKSIFGFSIWIILKEIIDKVNWSLDNFLLGKISGIVSVSIYSIASQINHIYIQTSTAISGVMLPNVTKKNEEKNDNMKYMNELWIKTGRIQLFIVGLILSGYIVFGQQFILLWVGKEYQESYIVGCALMIPMIISLIQNVSGSILQAKNKHQFMTIIYTIMAVLNVILSIPLIKKFGPLGAALGTGISLVIGNIIIKNIYYYVSIKLDVKNFFKSILPTMIGQVILGLVSFIVVSKLSINSWLLLFIGIAIYTIIYSIMIFSLFMNKYEKDLINNLLYKLKIKRKCKA